MEYYMANHILITRPDHDLTTRYISAWAEEYIDLAKTKGFTIIDLKRDRANRDSFESILKKKNPNFVIINGHGNTDEVTGYDNDTLIKINDNEDILSNKVTYALSCQSAKNLGKKVGNIPNTTYIGYLDDFIFVYLEKYRTKPLFDNLASTFLKPSNMIPTALLKGHTTDVAVLKAKDEFSRNIKSLLKSNTNSDDYSTVRYLVWNMKNLIAYGDQKKKI